MARFRVEVSIGAPVPVVWARLTDWPSHARLAPFTRIEVIGSGDRPGTGFVARTGVGFLAFDDPMELEEFRPPGEQPGGPGAPAARFRVRKTGRVVLGRVEAELWPSPGPGESVGSGGPDRSGGPGRTEGTRLVWDEEIRLAPVRLTRPVEPLLGRIAGFGYRASLRRLARQIEGERRGHDG